jgi:hypothetical protein
MTPMLTDVLSPLQVQRSRFDAFAQTTHLSRKLGETAENVDGDENAGGRKRSLTDVF